MTEQQLKSAKVLEEEEGASGRLVLLDLRSVGILNVFPQFAVYERRNGTHYFIAGSNDERSAWEAYQNAKKRRRSRHKR